MKSTKNSVSDVEAVVGRKRNGVEQHDAEHELDCRAPQSPELGGACFVNRHLSRPSR